MNPPGGISLLIHIFIIIFSVIKRAVKFISKKVGISDSKAMKVVKRPMKIFKNDYVQRTMSSFIILSMFSLMVFTFIVLVYGIISNETNIDHLIYLASLVKKIF